MSRSVRQLLLGAVAVSVVVVSAVTLGARRPDAPPAVQTMARSSAPVAAPALSQAFRQATQRAQPGVVNVQTLSRRSQVPAQLRGTPLEEVHRAPREASGSGLIFRSDGYILTNNHVIEGAERVSVVLQDRREFDARVVGRDPNTEIAVLRIDATDLPVVEFGDSDDLDVGDWVVALGYPLQLGATATAGIVSAKGRSINILRSNTEASVPLENFIQTDAAINPGNSGGPLVDLEGRAVGVNTAIASPTGFYSGYGFAIPINLARRVADDLIRYGEVHRPRLGVAIEDVGPVDAEVYGLDCVCGVQVIGVTAGTPAARAGMKLGDVIRSVDGRPVHAAGELLETLALLAPGQQVSLEVVRAGQPRTVGVRLDAFEPAVRAQRDGPPAPETGVARLGFAAREVAAERARGYGLGSAAVVIEQIDPTHPAARTRLQPNLAIEALNGRAIRSLTDLRAAADGLQAGQAVSLIVRDSRGEATIVNYRVRG